MPKGRLNGATWLKTLAERTPRTVYEGAGLRCVAMPLGGIGTGSIALCGDGSLRQWQIVNQVNHIGYIPNSFFAVWVAQPGYEPVGRVLQTRQFFYQDEFRPAPEISDHLVPTALRRWAERVPCVEETRFRGEYPLATLTYHDPMLPVEIELEAFSPFTAFDAGESGVPAILFTFKVRNRGRAHLRAALMASLENFVGWDGVSLINGVQNPGFGSNQTSLHAIPGRPTLLMVNSQLPNDHPSWGEVALAAFADKVTALPQWDDIEQMWHDFEPDGTFPPAAVSLPSGPWRTWAGSLSATFSLAAGEEKEITFVYAWYFPNRYVNWGQPGDIIKDTKSKFWLGNHYNRFGSVMPVVHKVFEEQEAMRVEARRFRETFYSAGQPQWFLNAATANITPARTNICLRTETGEFYGFEGGCGASTGGAGESGGCCALNCTHVWNYEMTIARLWPELERSMRRTDWLVNQHPTGYLPHRTTLPEFLPRLWEVNIGGPEEPAMDGLFGGVLKTCREFLACGDKQFLTDVGVGAFRAMDYAMEKLDTDGDGVLKGKQGNTYDIHVYGANTFIGSLYLAALLAAARMADAVGDTQRAKAYRDRFALGSAGYDRICWNGEYYRQVVDYGEHPRHQYGNGCVSDQLLGQWWAHVLGLGYVLPKDHVKQALNSIFKYNFRDSFEGVVQTPRVFASEQDRGLMVASYPYGDKQDVPLCYSDEVWTGIEYQVAGHMLYEGLITEGLAVAKAVRDRYDGFERSPWNEVECGDHYVRSMSSWSLVDLVAGMAYEADLALMRFGPRWQAEDFVGFFAAGKAYGLYRQKIDSGGFDATIEVAGGELPLATLVLDRAGPGVQGAAELDRTTLAAKVVREGEVVTVTLPEPVNLSSDSRFRVRLRP